MSLLDLAAAFADRNHIPPTLTWLPEAAEARHALREDRGRALLILEGRSPHLPGLLFIYHLEAERAFLAHELPFYEEDRVPRRFFVLDPSGAEPTEITLRQALESCPSACPAA